MNPLLEVKRHGQSIWLDNLSRTLLHEGTLKGLIETDGISGVTSNPSIFHKAVADSPYYRDDLTRLKAEQPNPEQRYESLVIPDIRDACDLLAPVFRQTGGIDGYVSLEVSPRIAYDEELTVDNAVRLAEEVARDNLLIKVPATPAGVRAFQRLIEQGINVNVTLLFSLEQITAVFEAYIRGMRTWVAAGGEPSRPRAVASLFLSRVDTLVDKQLAALGGDAAALQGKSAVAMARLAYQRYREIFHGEPFADLAEIGCRPQYPLWASTGTKNAAYSDLLYVEPLIGPETVNTVPDATLAAFRDHGRAALTLEDGIAEARDQYRRLEQAGIDMTAAGAQLQEDGVRLFDEAYAKLLELVA